MGTLFLQQTIVDYERSITVAEFGPMSGRSTDAVAFARESIDDRSAEIGHVKHALNLLRLGHDHIEAATTCMSPQRFPSLSKQGSLYA